MTTRPLPNAATSGTTEDGELRVAAEHMVDTLLEHGTEYVFICPGSTEAAFLHAAAERPELTIVLTTHEGVAVSMADGLARETGRPAVAYLHANVGLTNGLNQLYAAQLSYSPVVLLTGLKQTQIQSRGGFTTARAPREFVQQYTKWEWQSLRAEDVTFDLDRAFQVAAAPPAGPTWVGVAQDLAEELVPRSSPVRSRDLDAGVRPPPSALTRSAGLIAGAQRPIVVVGGDVARAGGVGSVLELAEHLGGPVYVEDRRGFERTVVPGDHPLYAGQYDPRRSSVAEADLVLYLGGRCFTEFEAPERPEVPQSAAVIHVHADPIEVGKIYGADVGVAADAGAFAADLLASLHERGVASIEHPEQIAAARAENQAIRDRYLADEAAPDGHTSVGEVMAALAGVLDADTIVVGDATTSGKALVHAVEGTEARFHTTSSGALGWGIGAALGVQLGAPGQHVVAVCGDGAFQFGLPGLWTAARYGIPVTFVVVNNSAYAAVGAAIRRYAGEVTARERELVVDLSGPRMATVASGFGIRSIQVESAREMGEAVAAAATTSGPTVIEVMTDPRDLGP